MMVAKNISMNSDGGSQTERRQRALLQETAAGDRRAFQRLYMLTYPNVLGFSMRLVARHDRAEEVANDTMVAVWRSADRFEGRSKVSTWMFGIAYRIAMKSHRHERGERLHVDLDAAGELHCDTSPDAAMLIEGEALKAAMAALPSDIRAIFVMTYQYGFSIAEVAEATECPEGTIKTRMAAARQKLRELMTKGSQP